MSPGKNIKVSSDWKIDLHRFEAFAGLALATLLVWYAAAPSHGSRQPSAVQRGAELSSLQIAIPGESSFPGSRDEFERGPLYPYSIIPGGVESADELRKAVANDPVVAAHYAGFDLGRARVVRLTEARFAYVSYRKGNSIFWTSKKMSLPAGETVITDGARTSRTRCGNQLSDVPRSPVAPAGEPTPETLATPLLVEKFAAPVELPIVMPFEIPLGMPIDTPALAGDVPVTGGGTEAGGTGGRSGGIILPSGSPAFLAGGGGPSSSSSSPSSPSTPSTPISTPEPSTLLLTIGGAAAALLGRKLRSKQAK